MPQLATLEKCGRGVFFVSFRLWDVVSPMWNPEKLSGTGESYIYIGISRRVSKKNVTTCQRKVTYNE